MAFEAFIPCYDTVQMRHMYRIAKVPCYYPQEGGLCVPHPLTIQQLWNSLSYLSDFSPPIFAIPAYITHDDGKLVALCPSAVFVNTTTVALNVCVSVSGHGTDPHDVAVKKSDGNVPDLVRLICRLIIFQVYQ